MRTLITAPKSPRHRRWKQGLNYLKAVILQASGRLPIEVNNEEKNIESCIVKTDCSKSENMVKYFQESERDEKENELHKGV